jgi:hypothetical protein
MTSRNLYIVGLAIFTGLAILWAYVLRTPTT